MDARHHIDELQSLRGIAALVVAASHLSSIYDLPATTRVVIDSVCNAHASIVVFYVLSGYVLTGSLLRRGLAWPSIKNFYLGRLFRLFPALWVASAISALFLFLSPTGIIHPQPSEWFVRYLTPFPSEPRLLLALLAIDRSLIMPVWTIFIELIGSLFMPLIVSIALAKTRLFNWLLVGMGVAAYFLAYAPHRLNSLSNLFEFGLGAWLASRKGEPFLSNPFPRLLGAAVVLVFFRSVWFAVRAGHGVSLSFDYDDPVSTIVEAIAAFFLVGALASEHGRIHLLRSRKVIWLGNISYSLYLIHFPVAIFVARILSQFFSAGTSAMTATVVLMTMGLAISCALAFLMYRFIEIPAIALGRRVSSALS